MTKFESRNNIKCLLRVLATLLVTIPSLVNADDDGVILRTPEFTVTEQDFQYYLVERDITEEDAKRIFAREGMVKNALENIYVIKAYASIGTKNDAIDMEEVEWLVNHYRDRLLMNRQLELEINEILVNTDWEALALEHYIANRRDFISPELVDASHILITTGERSEEAALALANEVLGKLGQGEDFAVLASEYSDDTGSKTSGGKLGAFGRGMMVYEFEEAAFGLQNPGDLSGLVKSDFGIHIIRLNERIEPRQMSYEEVKNRLVPDLRKAREQQVRNTKLSAIKTGQVDLGLEVNLPLLEEIEARYEPGPDNRLNLIRETLGVDD